MEPEETQQFVKGASARAQETATALFTAWQTERERLPLDRVVEAELKARRFLNSHERRFASEAIYGVVRNLRALTFLAEQAGQAADGANLVALWREFFSPLRTNAPNSLPTPENPAEYLRVALSYTDEMAAELENLLVDEAIAAGEAFNTPAPVTLRVNTLKVSRAKVQELFPFAVPTPFSPWGLTLSGRIHLPSLPEFAQGWFEMQEEASQTVALLCDAKPEQTLVEIGAGGGGKTLALAALMRNTGRIVAMDITATRLGELQKRAKRAGVTCVETHCLAADTEGVWQEDAAKEALDAYAHRADCVLIDAPCTGSGTLRRSPDTKWRDINRAHFERIQTYLIQQGAAFVAPGGLLCYVTCAFEAWQNEAIVAAFLASEAGQNFAPEPPPAAFTEFADGAYLRTWPHRHGLDAFFVARLRRRGNE